MSQNRKGKSEGGVREGKRRKEQVGWYLFYSKNNGTISSREDWSCSSPSLRRIGFDKRKYERSISGANCTIIYIPTSTCVVLEDKVRPSIRIRSRSCSSPPQPSSPLSRFLTNRLEISNSNMKWHNKTCFISLYPSSSFRTRLSRRTEKFIRLFRIAAYHGMKRYSS